MVFVIFSPVKKKETRSKFYVSTPEYSPEDVYNQLIGGSIGVHETGQGSSGNVEEALRQRNPDGMPEQAQAQENQNPVLAENYISVPDAVTEEAFYDTVETMNHNTDAKEMTAEQNGDPQSSLCAVTGIDGIVFLKILLQ
ncbi:MAG: hypothetical protein C5B47_03585 [Verrucomicrobia bacterium]|nr:MAG: hypothetical protein C5B47_03585 [Verrucomicrobiota bacterium]